MTKEHSEKTVVLSVSSKNPKAIKFAHDVLTVVRAGLGDQHLRYDKTWNMDWSGPYTVEDRADQRLFVALGDEFMGHIEDSPNEPEQQQSAAILRAVRLIMAGQVIDS